MIILNNGMVQYESLADGILTVTQEEYDAIHAEHFAVQCASDDKLGEE